MASDLKKFLYPKFLETIDPALSSHFSARHFVSGALPINFDADRSAVSTALLQLFQEEVMGRNKGIVAELFRVADIGNSKWMQTILNEGRRKDVVLDRDLGLNQGDPAAAKPDQKHVALEIYVYRPSIFKAAADFHASRVPAVLAELRRPQRNVGACLSEVAAEAFKSSAIKLLARDLQEAQISISGCILRSIPERERDELLRARLTEQPKGDIWSVCSYFDCGLDVRPIREIGRQLHACCPHDIAEDELLKSDDLRRFRIDADRLMRALPASTDLTALASQIADRLWSLGRLPSGRCLAPGAEVRSLGRRRRANLALRSAARSAPPVALTTDIDAATDVRSREGGVGTSPFPASIAVDAGGTEHLTLGV